jgi:hypothetical protein
MIIQLIVRLVYIFELVCKPKDQGGLGVINLSIQNDCLLMKHLHKFFNRANLPWVNLVWKLYYESALPPAKARDISFWWRDCLKSLPSYKGIASIFVGSGASILLWHNKWHGASLQGQFPHLYSFAKDDSSSVVKVDLADHFNLPLSEEAYSEFLHLRLLLKSLPGSR